MKRLVVFSVLISFLFLSCGPRDPKPVSAPSWRLFMTLPPCENGTALSVYHRRPNMNPSLYYIFAVGDREYHYFGSPQIFKERWEIEHPDWEWTTDDGQDPLAMIMFTGWIYELWVPAKENTEGLYEPNPYLLAHEEIHYQIDKGALVNDPHKWW